MVGSNFPNLEGRTGKKDKSPITNSLKKKIEKKYTV
jgi:hypothetical protein